MSKESGLGMTVTVDNAAGAAKDISNDITSIDFSTPRGVQDITGLDKSGVERLLLIADGQATINGVFNDTADMSHDVFKAIPSTSVVRTLTIGISGQQLEMEMVLTDYALSRAQGGEFIWTVPAQLANGAVPAWTTP